MLKLAIIGCGAVSENFHIPMVSNQKQFKLSALVDTDLNRAKVLAKKYNVPNITDDYRTLFKKVDAAIIALPHHLHAPVSIALLNHGIHILVEKPMALNTKDARKMITVAQKKKVVLAVGLVRRYFYNYQLAKKILSSGILGEIKSFNTQEGFIYNWNIKTDFMFNKNKGGGVLYDTGAHTLDTILWWLGDYQSVTYRDDSQGGVEANCLLKLVLRNGITGTIELSRTRDLRNSTIIIGTRATLEIAMDGSHISLRPNNQNLKLVGHVLPHNISTSTPQTAIQVFQDQLDDWKKAITYKLNPKISGEIAYKSVRLIENCYQSRRSLIFPWERSIKLNKTDRDLKHKTICITGATGFVGSRLVEILSQKYQAKIKVLVRNYAHLARIARFPIHVIHGDMLDMKAVERAIQNSDIVFHCAYGSDGNFTHQKQVTINGANNVFKAALKYNVKSIVYMSTISVYGPLTDGILTENSPYKPTSDIYANSKYKAEQTAFWYHEYHHLPISIIQPTMIYGPYGSYWTTRIINDLKNYQIILPDNGQGLNNPVYIDDVIQAMLLAATTKQAAGKKFLISATEPINWKKFYSTYEKMLKLKSTVPMTLSQTKKYNSLINQLKLNKNQLTIILKNHPDIF